MIGRNDESHRVPGTARSLAEIVELLHERLVELQQFGDAEHSVLRQEVNRSQSSANAPAQAASASSSPRSFPQRSLAAACISGFRALPLPVACTFNLTRLTGDPLKPASTAADPPAD
jgi:hypothetical protein